jgi:hypothetical protein
VPTLPRVRVVAQGRKRPMRKVQRHRPRRRGPARSGCSLADERRRGHTALTGAAAWRPERLRALLALRGSLLIVSRRQRLAGRRACICLIATATAPELPPIGSSHAPTSCLCTGCNGPDQVALLLVVRSERLRAARRDARMHAKAEAAEEVK